MSDARPDPAAAVPPTSLRQAASSAGLLVVMLVILAGSRFLRSGPPEHRPAGNPPPVPSLSPASPPEGFAPLERVPPSETPEAAPPDPSLVALAERASDDVARIARSKGPWTLQVSRHCSTSLVQDKVRRHGSAKEFFLLPAEQGERACFLVCWGTYADRGSAAKGASKVPAELKGDGRPFAKAVAEVLP